MKFPYKKCNLINMLPMITKWEIIQVINIVFDN